MKIVSNKQLMEWMEHGISEIGDQDPGSMAERNWFKHKMKDLKKLWKEKRISWEQVDKLYRMAQEEMNYRWEDREIEEILAT